MRWIFLIIIVGFYIIYQIKTDINPLFSLIFLTYIVVETFHHVHCNLVLFKKVLVYFRLKKLINKMIPSWWVIIKIFDIHRSEGDDYIHMSIELGSTMYKKRFEFKVVSLDEKFNKVIFKEKYSNSSVEVDIVSYIRDCDKKNGIDTDQLTKSVERDIKLKSIGID